jgi:transposase InsO family protein
VEPACAVLEFPVSTYYGAKKGEREPSPREQRDEWLKKEIMRVREDRKKGRRVYGARKVWRQLRRDGIEAARCTVARLMKELGIAGVSARRKKPRARHRQGQALPQRRRVLHLPAALAVVRTVDHPRVFSPTTGPPIAT